MNENQFLFLVNGEKEGQGFWKIGLTKHIDPLKADKCFLECYRQELVGSIAAEKILKAIEMNIQNLIKDCLSDGYVIEQPDVGISFDLPLTVLEEIYDFWTNLYTDNDLFEKVVALLTTRRKINFSHPSIIKGLKGFTAEWAQKLEELHSYRPPSTRLNDPNKPMW